MLRRLVHTVLGARLYPAPAPAYTALLRAALWLLPPLPALTAALLPTNPALLGPAIAAAATSLTLLALHSWAWWRGRGRGGGLHGAGAGEEEELPDWDGLAGRGTWAALLPPRPIPATFLHALLSGAVAGLAAIVLRPSVAGAVLGRVWPPAPAILSCLAWLTTTVTMQSLLGPSPPEPASTGWPGPAWLAATARPAQLLVCQAATTLGLYLWDFAHLATLGYCAQAGNSKLSKRLLVAHSNTRICVCVLALQMLEKLKRPMRKNLTISRVHLCFTTWSCRRCCPCCGCWACCRPSPPLCSGSGTRCSILLTTPLC